MTPEQKHEFLLANLPCYAEFTENSGHSDVILTEYADFLIDSEEDLEDFEIWDVEDFEADCEEYFTS